MKVIVVSFIFRLVDHDCQNIMVRNGAEKKPNLETAQLLQEFECVLPFCK